MGPTNLWRSDEAGCVEAAGCEREAPAAVAGGGAGVAAVGVEAVPVRGAGLEGEAMIEFVLTIALGLLILLAIVSFGSS